MCFISLVLFPYPVLASCFMPYITCLFTSEVSQTAYWCIWAKHVSPVSVRSITRQKMDAESTIRKNKSCKIVTQNLVATHTNSVRHFTICFTTDVLFSCYLRTAVARGNTRTLGNRQFSVWYMLTSLPNRKMFNIKTPKISNKL